MSQSIPLASVRDRPLVDFDPASTPYRKALGQAEHNYGVYLVGERRLSEALTHLDVARELRRELADENPDESDMQLKFCKTLLQAGELSIRDRSA